MSDVARGSTTEEFAAAYAEAVEAIRGELTRVGRDDDPRILLGRLLQSHLLNAPTVEDDAIAAIARERLLNAFHFTPIEGADGSAVGPDTFSHAFETSMSDRHETGAYYTPREVASFMCREALRGLLAERLPSITGHAIDLLIHDGDASAVSEPAAVATALDGVRVCDPSCGSGVFLVVMLQEIARIVETIGRSYTIGVELTGVEKDPAAAEMAEFRLRLASRYANGVEARTRIVVTDSLLLPISEPGVGRFDIVVANPPYVRADTQFKHMADEDARRAEVSSWQAYRSVLAKSRLYQTLYEKWDLYIPFIELGYRLLRPGGRAAFIIPDAYNTAKYALRSRDFLLGQTTVERIDFCGQMGLFGARVASTIVRFVKTPPPADHRPVRMKREGWSLSHFDRDVQPIPTDTQESMGHALFAAESRDRREGERFVPLGHICYISYGLRANSDDRKRPGEFRTEDCLSPTPDAIHPKPFVRGKDLERWRPSNVSYLEWGTERAPAWFSRPTFPELHEAEEKLIAARTPGARPKVIYDADGLRFDSSAVGFVPWQELAGVVNRSIEKTATYGQGSEPSREELERISEGFSAKYLLAVMNSAVAADWLAAGRRHKLHFYPDDWKSLPIPAASTEAQREIAALVDSILSADPKDRGRLDELEQEVERLIQALLKGAPS